MVARVRFFVYTYFNLGACCHSLPIVLHTNILHILILIHTNKNSIAKRRRKTHCRFIMSTKTFQTIIVAYKLLSVKIMMCVYCEHSTNRHVNATEILVVDYHLCWSRVNKKSCNSVSKNQKENETFAKIIFLDWKVSKLDPNLL